MTFEKDIFISYAHIDNAPLKEETGWVTNFHRALKVRLGQLMGEDPIIWRDQKLQGNDRFGDEIVDQFSKTAIMISILSPRYIKSEWCIKELREFHAVAEAGIGAKIDNKSRIFKVIKTVVPYEEHPPEITDILGYEFFVPEPHSDRVQELDQKCTGKLEQAYWAKLNDIAHDIRDLLVKLKQDQAEKPSSPTSKENKVVYLAETGIELKKQRDMVKRELEDSGCLVLPDTRLPNAETEFQKAVDSYLEQSSLAIHLVGGGYGSTLKGSQESIIRIQNQLAVEKSRTENLQRMIWLPPGHFARTDNQREKEFLLELRHNPEFQYGADFFETPIEDFKSALREKLEDISPDTPSVSKPQIPSFTSEMTVFLAETSHELRELREHIKGRLLAQGCKVLPVHTLPLLYPELVDRLDDLLAQCDISIHLLGTDYGIVPDQSEKSTVFIQAQQAAKKSRQGQIMRLVCMPWNVDSGHIDERQQLLIKSLKEERGLYPHDDIFEMPFNQTAPVILEKIKIIEENRNKKKEEETTQAVQQHRNPKQIYLICDRNDREHVTQLGDFLFNEGYDVAIQAFDGDEKELEEDHRENLIICDAAIIYYGAGNKFWMRSISRSFKKIPGYGRDGPLALKAVFLAPPVTPAKQEPLLSHGFLTINGMEGFSPPLMKPFLEELNALGAEET